MWHYFCVEDSTLILVRVVVGLLDLGTRSARTKKQSSEDQPILMGPSHGAADSLEINGDLAGTHLLFRRLTYAQSNRVLPLHMLDVKISVP